MANTEGCAYSSAQSGRISAKGQNQENRTFVEQKLASVRFFVYLCAVFFQQNRVAEMTYEEYISQEQQAMEEEQREDSCFVEYQPEGQFVRGH